MSYFYNAIFLIFVLFATEGLAAAPPEIELRTKTRIARGEPAIFKARMLGSGIKKMRLRYKSALDEEYAWSDFERDAEGSFIATVAPHLILSSSFYYYVVSQNESGAVETLYGTPNEPFRITVDRRPANGVLHQNNAPKKMISPHLSVKDRFGDDDAGQQMSVFVASDNPSLTSRIERNASLGPKMSSERLEQMGGRDLADILRSFPNFDFVSTSTKPLQPVFNGFGAQARVKLKIDDVELIDEFDGSSEWMLDAMSIVGISIVDSPTLLMGESKGLLSEINVETPNYGGFAGRLRGGWPYDVAGAMVAGRGFGAFENSASAALRQNQDAVLGSLLLKTEYWWDKNPKPFMIGRLQIFGVSPEQNGARRITWNGALRFDLPFSLHMNSKLSFVAGQTFVDQTLHENRSYRLLRTGLQFSNDLLLHPLHLLSIGATGNFFAIANAPFNFETKLASGEKLGFEIGACEVLGMRTSAVSNCRLKANVNSRYRFQIANWTAVSAGMEFVVASGEANELRSMFHPSAFLEISPSASVDLVAGYSSTLRWPTFLEKSSFLQNEVEIHPLPGSEVDLLAEKLRQVLLQMRWRYKSDYAYLTLDAQGRSGWLDDQIVLSPVLKSGRVWSNKGDTRFSALNLGMTAKLASANQVYIGSEFHTPSTLFPNMKIVLGTRLNLGNIGSMHFELQSLSYVVEKQVSLMRVKAFYQTRPLFEHLIFEAHAAQSFSISKPSEDSSFSGVFASAKVLL